MQAIGVKEIQKKKKNMNACVQTKMMVAHVRIMRQMEPSLRGRVCGGHAGVMTGLPASATGSAMRSRARCRVCTLKMDPECGNASPSLSVKVN